MKANSDISQLISNPQGQDGASLLDKAESMIFALNDETNINDQNLQSMRELIPSTMDRLHELSNKSDGLIGCLLYTSPSPRDGCRSRMPSSA